MAEEVGSFIIGLVVGLGIGCGFGGDWSNKALLTPTITVTTINGVAKVTVNGSEVNRQKVEALKATYEKLLAEWPKESTDE